MKHKNPEDYPSALDAVADGHSPDVVARALGFRDAAHWQRNAEAVAYMNRAEREGAERKRAREAGEHAPRKRAPSGGLDLKAMSAAWRKAGKPGDWRSWCKVHPIKASK